MNYCEHGVHKRSCKICTTSEQGYLDLLEKIMREGNDRMTRNGMTRALFAQQLRFNLADGFPAVTTKKLAFKVVKGELLWFLEMGKSSKRANDERLKEILGTDRTIWTDNAEAPYWLPKSQGKGDLGRIYGMQWRDWISPYSTFMRDSSLRVDQLATVIDRLKKDPYDRRLVVSAWNPGELDDMALPPCHMMFQFFVSSGRLSLHMIQRSCDMFLGVPFNIASYALLTHMVAQVVDLEPGELVLSLNDVHIYHDHIDAVKEQLKREPYPLPQLILSPDVKDIDDFTMDDIMLQSYQSHPTIKAKMAV